MDAKITGNSERVGLSVIDDNDVEHLVEMDAFGDIEYYEQDGYPEQSERSTEQDIRIEQAAQYAKYYVQRELGHPTFEPRLTPEWLAYALGAVFLLDFEEFERHFGVYHQQYHSQLREGVEPIVEVPAGTDIGGIVFRADVSHGLSFDDYLADPDGLNPIDGVEGITDDYDLVTELGEQVREHLDAEADPVAEVSALDVFYQQRAADRTVEDKTVGASSPSQECAADAQLQMTPPQASLETDLSIEIFQGLVLHHLTCQVRDAYLRLEIEPPEPFRILGQGLYKQTIRYQHTDVYEPYHLTDADIEGYRAPGFDTGAVGTPENRGRSLRKTIERALFGRG